jgi:hypothetical protein
MALAQVPNPERMSQEWLWASRHAQHRALESYLIRAYHCGMRRTNPRFTLWLIRLPLWRYLLTYYVMSLVAAYAIFWAGSWAASRALNWPSRDLPTQFYFAYAAATTVGGLIGRPIWRRKYGLTPQHRQP